MCADMAAKTAELINEYIAGGVVSPYQTPEDIAYCMECHNPGSDAPGTPAQLGQMDCYGCHTHEGAIVGAKHYDGGGGGGGML